jgi:DNA-binding transcriptional LysR family regulator
MPTGHELAPICSQRKVRYALPPGVREFSLAHPGVALRMRQGTPRHGARAAIVLEAMDADVIKTYVELGMGVGIVAAIAWDEQRDARLRMIDARHLFATNLTRLAIQRGAWLRGYVYDFIETFAPPLTRKVVEQAVADGVVAATDGP